MKKWIIALVLLLAVAGGIFLFSDRPQGKIEKTERFQDSVEELRQFAMDRARSEGVGLFLNGHDLRNFGYDIRITEDMHFLCPERFLEDIMGCSILRDAEGNVTIDRGKTKILLTIGSDKAVIDGENVTLASEVFYDKEKKNLYLPMEEPLTAMGYATTFSYAENAVNVEEIVVSDPLPERYDMRETGRVTPVRDQGNYGTCWAFASLGALETTTMPYEENEYSTDHMTLNNSYKLGLYKGGEHTMSIAYLAAWQGPVYEADDPYDDGVTDESLQAVKHLEEAIVISERDDEVIKSAIYRYGGVETSLHLEMEYSSYSSPYYNEKTAAYYYNGAATPNHDVVVVGWDDNYPRTNFAMQPEIDGAYICKNSWGEEFGEKGYFYVSYADVNLCGQSIVYTRLADPDNFDHIYQSDLLGWVGQLGFGQSVAYFANCFTAERDEDLAGVSFYAVGPRTYFSVYYVPDATTAEGLNERTLLVSGETRYAGYYTINLPEPQELSEGQKFAIVMMVDTPGTKLPIVVEYAADERTAGADITDGEGYISQYGRVWNRAEEKDCNVCLKVFTKDR